LHLNNIQGLGFIKKESLKTTHAFKFQSLEFFFDFSLSDFNIKCHRDASTILFLDNLKNDLEIEGKEPASAP
jgi:hypothetical protein